MFDDFSNSSPIALDRARACWACGRISVAGDTRRHPQPQDLEKAFTKAPSEIDAVIHFAGLKAVGEFVEKPLHYWDVNVNGSRCMLEAMQCHGCHTLVFSSSAMLYGYPEAGPIPETARIAPINPYGYTKAAVEKMLANLHASAPAPGGSLTCAISTSSGPIRQAALAKIRWASPTTCSLS